MAYQSQHPMQPMQPMPFHQENGGEWKSSLFVGKTADRLRHPSATPSSTNSDCAIHGALCFFTGFHWVYTMLKRTEIRERFGIPGSACGDCCTSFWCHCCAVIQQDNEVKSRLHAGGPIQQQYQQQQGMLMPQGPPQSYIPPQKEGYTYGR
ncbi:hypothetical protein TruAng_008090 [Truncatella angustata]|nr:hypothetical protein TruAng_008090 [Truncatella angustata]